MPALTVFRVVRENSSQTDRKSEERIAGCATMIMVGVREGECHPEALRFRLRFRLRLVSYLTHVHHGESVNFEGEEGEEVTVLGGDECKTLTTQYVREKP